ncbi:Glycosyl transferase family 2 [Oscillospiraceae bacterium]|nr:Glycosyl transferase family 2 [Oscillospiraceae bacterium]
MKTSIVLSTYNGEKYIIEQLESLKSQTLAPDEVIISDDCSTDSTVELCKTFIADNGLEKWHVITHETNKGWAENFSDAFLLASGDLIFPCDQDDIWIEDKIEKMTEIMESHSEIGLLIGNYEKWIQNEKEDRIVEQTYSGKLTHLPFNEKVIYMDYPGCVYCFRKSFYDDILPYRFENYPHDAFLLRMAKTADACYLLDIPVIKWRRHTANTTGKPVRTNEEMANRTDYYIQCLQKMKDYCNDHDMTDKIPLIDENLEFYTVRGAAFRNRKILGKNSLFSCVKYMKFYPRTRSILGDAWRLIH